MAGRVALPEDEIDFERDQFFGKLRSALGLPVGPAIDHFDGAAVDPAEFREAIDKSFGPCRPGLRRGRAQKSDGRNARGLRTGSERPSSRTGKQRDQLASPHPCFLASSTALFTMKQGRLAIHQIARRCRR